MRQTQERTLKENVSYFVCLLVYMVESPKIYSIYGPLGIFV